jgi:pyrimidine operon attenuation protein/uracil phosphoribosyltransferase
MKQIMTQAELNRAIKRLAYEIVEKNDGLDDVVLIGIRTRGVCVAERIQSFLKQTEGVELPLGILDITLYRDDLLHCDAEVKGTEIDFEIGGKSVVLCDDVLYSGRTVRAAISALNSYSAKMGRPSKIALLEIVDRGIGNFPLERIISAKTYLLRLKKRWTFDLWKRMAKKGCFYTKTGGRYENSICCASFVGEGIRA